MIYSILINDYMICNLVVFLVYILIIRLNERLFVDYVLFFEF